MWIKNFFVPVLFILNFLNLSAAFSSTPTISDTSINKVKDLSQTPDVRFHFAFIYGKANFNTRNGVINAFSESGYPYHVVSQADPSAVPGHPTVYSFTIEGNITKQVSIGMQFSKTMKQEITGSNWIGAIQDERPIPVGQFDVKESYSAKYVNGTINYVVVPVNFVHSRWELAVGAGISYNRLKRLAAF